MDGLAAAWLLATVTTSRHASGFPGAQDTAWTVRAGAGLFYSQDTGNPRFDMSRNIAGRRTDLVNPDFPDLNWKTPFRGLGGTLNVSNPFVLANVHQRRTPYVMQYLLNIQRQISANTVLEVGYTGSTSRKLEALRLFNQPLPSPVGSAQSRSPYPELGLIQMVDGTGKARYDSLMLRVQRRFAAGLTYLLSYTWSKSIDTGSAIRVHNTEYLFPQNNYCIDCERGVSSFHVGQRWITSALYELPFGRGRRYLQNGVARYIAGGWQLGSIVTLQTGLPFTAVLASQRSNTTGVLSDRPDATGRARGPAVRRTGSGALLQHRSVCAATVRILRHGREKSGYRSGTDQLGLFRHKECANSRESSSANSI